MRAKVAILSGVQFWVLIYTLATVFIVFNRQRSWSGAEAAAGSIALLILIVAIGWRYTAALKPERPVEAVATGIWWVFVFALLDYLAVKPFDSTLYEQLPYFVGLLLVFFTPLLWLRKHHSRPKDESVGVIPVRETDEGWEFLVIQHRHGHWDFPKGHPEAGEAPQETAARELTEECGLTIQKWLSPESLIINYVGEKDGQAVDKTVTFYVAQVAGKIQLEEGKILDSKWGDYRQTRRQLTHQNSRRLLKQVLSIVKTTSN